MMVLLVVAFAIVAMAGLAPVPKGRPILSETEAKANLEKTLAMAKRVGASKKSKRDAPPPVLLVPGVGGSILFQTRQNATTSPPHFFCEANMAWQRAWLDLSELLPEVWDCFAWSMSRKFVPPSEWRDHQGVTTAHGVGLDAINYLDPDDALTRHETIYFAATTAALLAAGYVANETMDGMPYDWRMHPGESGQALFWPRFQAKIESLYQTSGGQPVTILSHSRGGLMTQYFLTQVASRSWKQQYVSQWIAVCPPFGGAAVAVRAILSGYNFGIFTLSNGEGYEVGLHFGSTYFLLPQNYSFWGTVVSSVQGNNYAPQQLPALFDLSGLPDAADRVVSASAGLTMKDPDVPVKVVAGSNKPTEVGYLYDETNFVKGPVKTYVDSGDGTVPLDSAMLPVSGPQRWSNIQSQVFPGVEHVAMLADEGFLSWLMNNL